MIVRRVRVAADARLAGDDFEDAESVRSEEQRMKKKEWVQEYPEQEQEQEQVLALLSQYKGT